MTITPREGAQPQHRQCASTGRLSAVMFIGQLGWAAVGAACGTLLAALAAEVKPEDKVDLLALLTTTGAIAAVSCMILAGTLSDRTRFQARPAQSLDYRRCHRRHSGLRLHRLNP